VLLTRGKRAEVAGTLVRMGEGAEAIQVRGEGGLGRRRFLGARKGSWGGGRGSIKKKRRQRDQVPWGMTRSLNLYNINIQEGNDAAKLAF